MEIPGQISAEIDSDALFGSLTVPFHRFGVVLRQASQTALVHDTERCLGNVGALLGKRPT